MVYNLHLLKTRRPRQHVKYESKPKLDTCSTAKNKTLPKYTSLRDPNIQKSLQKDNDKGTIHPKIKLAHC